MAPSPMNVVRHRMPFHQLHPKLPTEIFQYPSDLFAQDPVDCLLTILRYYDELPMKQNLSSSESVAALPKYLKERCRLLNGQAIKIRGELVLYWMHHSVRGHENPALDVAIALGNRLDLPVLVYQGLGGNHGYDSDRHHTFIMQGARDAHRELRERGVGAVFDLNRRGDQPSPLRQLAMRAAAVVIEDFPAPPFPRCTERLAEHSPVALISVDCFCIVPMQAQPQRFTRAFEFRRHNQAGFERRMPLPWPDIEPK